MKRPIINEYDRKEITLNSLRGQVLLLRLAILKFKREIFKELGINYFIEYIRRN